MKRVGKKGHGKMERLCPKYGKYVSNLPRHTKRVHDTQSWIYKCPTCCRTESRFDKNFMLKHIKSEHKDAIKFEECIANVSGASNDSFSTNPKIQKFQNLFEDALNEASEMLKNSKL